ncbi:MAG TPA: hypothetical protein VHW23_35590 [Kofleriaceae bacterium]|jgi:hypothetical protein|nr:hypothetical protein [Kofleriaceae bacterium]
MKNELTTIDRDLLGNTHGGDFASKYWNSLKSDAKDWWGREKAAATAAHNHDVGGTAKNLGGALLDEVGGIGDALTPITGIVGAKP